MSRKVAKDASPTAKRGTKSLKRNAGVASSPSDFDLPVSGSASPEVQKLVIETWSKEAEKSGICLEGFDPKSTLAELVAWARAAGLLVAAVLSRFSTKMQHSTEAQVVECVQYAARNGMFVIPHFVCVDEAVKGSKQNRDGLNRMKLILEQRLIDVLLVFKLSRLFRRAFMGLKFFEQDCLENGIRAIATSQGVDTRDKKAWKLMCTFHGINDEMLLETIADFVRSGLAELFRNNYVTGALPIGYVAREVPGGRRTKLGKPRTMPAVNEDVAALIRKHFEYHRNGMRLVEGWRRWIAAGGPCDRRSKKSQISRGSYGRMLRNPRYTGRWAFGKNRNVWSSSLDYTKQEPQPESEVTLVHCEDLRIVSDELFFAVQATLPKTGRSAPKTGKKRPQLWDMVADVFVCGECSQKEDQRFYHYGAGNKSMVCRRRELCPTMTAINRKIAVRSIVDELCKMINRDADLVAAIVTKAQELDAHPEDDVKATIESLRSKISVLSKKLDDLYELAGAGSDADREEIKSRIRAAQVQRSQVQSELARAERQLGKIRTVISVEEVHSSLQSLRSLLEDAAAGVLGDDLVYRASYIFKMLVGSRIVVSVEKRPGRKRTVVRGSFKPQIMKAVAESLEVGNASAGELSEIAVWLRPPPQCDMLAVRVHELVDGHGLSYSDAADVLFKEGHGRMSAVRVSTLYGRYYEMIDEPRPPHPYNNGRPRKPKQRRS